MQIKAGSKITTYTGGGGGFEQANERKTQDVLEDVKNKYVSIEKAKEDFKVIITPDLTVNDELTNKLRNSE